MHPRRLEKNANITLKSALLPQAVSHGGRGAAPWLPLWRGRRDNVISYVVSPIVFHLWERRSEVRVFGLKRPERREFGLKPQKA
jgi:hypothetical protein